MARISFFGNTKFRKRMNLAPGVSANFGKTESSFSIGQRGCKTTFGKNGVRTTVGILGTGMSTSTYRPYNSKRKSPSKSSSGYADIVPIRSRQSNMAWGFIFLILSFATIIFSFTYPNLMDFGRWIISISCGGFFLIGAIIFFTAKSKERYVENLNEVGNKLDRLEENLNDVKEVALTQNSAQISSNEIDKLLKCFYEKIQEYYRTSISYIHDKDNIQLKEKAYSIWAELQIQIKELDSVAGFMIPRQSEYYNAIKPKESNKPV